MWENIAVEVSASNKQKLHKKLEGCTGIQLTTIATLVHNVQLTGLLSQLVAGHFVGLKETHGLMNKYTISLYSHLFTHHTIQNQTF